MDAMSLAKEAAAAAMSRKALRPVIMDLKGQSDLCDYQFICSGSNAKQTQAIATAIEDHCRGVGGIKPSAIEGKQSGNWILMDYGAILVHIFCEDVRNYYAVESIWPQATLLEVKIGG